MLNEEVVIGVINSHGVDIQTMSCILSGILHQLSISQGTAGVEAARQFAVEVAKGTTRPGPTQPDVERINAFFSQHK